VSDPLDRDALIGYFDKRLDASVADDEAMRAYWAGRIDGHCLQNAIDFHDLMALADRHGFRVDWPSALEVTV
jgi:hypothetical protein